MNEKDVEKMIEFFTKLSNRLWAIWKILHQTNPELSYVQAATIGLHFKNAMDVENEFRRWLQKEHPKLAKKLKEQEEKAKQKKGYVS